MSVIRPSRRIVNRITVMPDTPWLRVPVLRDPPRHDPRGSRGSRSSRRRATTPCPPPPVASPSPSPLTPVSAKLDPNFSSGPVIGIRPRGPLGRRLHVGRRRRRPSAACVARLRRAAPAPSSPASSPPAAAPAPAWPRAPAPTCCTGRPPSGFAPPTSGPRRAAQAHRSSRPSAPATRRPCQPPARRRTRSPPRRARAARTEQATIRLSPRGSRSRSMRTAVTASIATGAASPAPASALLPGTSRRSRPSRRRLPSAGP